MKKVLVLLIGLAAASQVFAQLTTFAACTNGTPAVLSATTFFIRTDVATKCSNNVNLKFSETLNGAAVASSSTKGKYIFTGNTGGGNIGPNGGVCAQSTCTAGQLDAPLATALAAAT
jgi:hypothetical protein